MDKPIIDKTKTVCFSGHRPEKLPFKGAEEHYTNRMLKSLLYKEIQDCVFEGYDCFITGLARGIDLWAGEIVLELRAKNPGIKLVAALPYNGFNAQYKGYERWVSGNILHKSSAIFSISERYHSGCMKERNYFMVDNSSKLIAMLADGKSGTGQTIRYAQKQGILIKLFDINSVSDDFNRSYPMGFPADYVV